MPSATRRPLFEAAKALVEKWNKKGKGEGRVFTWTYVHGEETPPLVFAAGMGSLPWCDALVGCRGRMSTSHVAITKCRRNIEYDKEWDWDSSDTPLLAALRKKVTLRWRGTFTTTSTIMRLGWSRTRRLRRSYVR